MTTSFFLKILARTILFALLLISLTDCAKPSSPSGGPRDKEPPQVERTVPENKSLRFTETSVKFYFDEAIKVGTYGKEIFISPLPQKKPKIRLSDSAKKLTISFEEELRPQTTYVITLTEVTDFNAGNKMTEAYTLAFSTGDQLDSLRISGRILSPVIGQPVKDMTVMLFDADSVLNNNLFRKSPAYITKPNEQGEFIFDYLRNTEYRVFAVADKDQTNTYSQPSERIAVAADSVVRFPPDSIAVSGLELYAFIADNQPPLFQSYVWLSSQTLLLKFSENLRLDTLRGYVADTFGQSSSSLTDYTWFPNPDPELLLSSPRSRDLPSQISLLEIYDSLYNRLDTLFQVGGRRRRALTAPLLTQPEWQSETLSWKLISYRPWQEADRNRIFLTDTSRVDSLRQRFPVAVENEAFRLTVRPQGALSPGPYVLNVAGDYFLPQDSVDTDTTFRYPVSWPDPASFGTLSGVVKLERPFAGPIVMELWADKARVRSVRDTVFAFTNLKAQNYFVRVILDTDSSGTWTTGSLWPPRMPERIFEDRSELTIKANWDFEGHEVVVKMPEPAKVEADSVEVK